MNCCKLTLSDVVGCFYGWEGTKVHLGVGQRMTHRNGMYGMRGMRAYGTKFNAGMLTYRNGMSGMRGMRAYSTKFNAGMLAHRNGMSGMRGMRACVTHRNGMLGMSRMLELTRFF